MKKQIVLSLCYILLWFPSALAKNYLTTGCIIVSDLDPRYVDFIQLNIGAYHEHLSQYFPVSWPSPLTVYYSKNQSDTQELLKEHGHKIEATSGCYIAKIPAIYTHQFMNNRELNGWGELFHEITHHFIYINFNDPPAWFSEGLASFWGEQAIIVGRNLVIIKPNPTRDQILRDQIESDIKPNIKRLFSIPSEQFYKWDIGLPFARAFFCWLYETGKLEQYLTNAKQKGYDISVLEETVSKPAGKISVELLKFIKKNCYAGAYLKDGLQASDPDAKRQAFLNALQLKPDYTAALLELAKLDYQNKDYEKCRENLRQILGVPENAEYRQAAELLGDTYYYNEKNYTKALGYYNTAWEYSDYYVYKYRTAYKIANCHYYLKGFLNAKDWYAKFLDNKWEADQMKVQTEYVLKYLGRTNSARSTQTYKDSKENTEQKMLRKESELVSKKTMKVKLETSMGNIVIELNGEAAPLTTKNFLKYVEEGFFDGTIFHRVIPNFMIQAGGFTPEMERKKTHEPTINEASNGLKNDRGTIAMARTNDPNSATSQFFINQKNNDSLNYIPNRNPGYAVFGKVIEGMDVVDAIAAVKTARNGPYTDVPVEPVVIKSATLILDK